MTELTIRNKRVSRHFEQTAIVIVACLIGVLLGCHRPVHNKTSYLVEQFGREGPDYIKTINVETFFSKPVSGEAPSLATGVLNGLWERTLESTRHDDSTRLAFESIGVILSEPACEPFRASFVRQCAQDMLHDSRSLSSSLGSRLSLLKDYGLEGGLDDETVNQLILKMRATEWLPMKYWCRFLAAMGTRDCIVELQRIAKTPSRRFLHNSALLGTRWQGFLPTVENWIVKHHDEAAFEYSILVATTEGRQVLLDIALEESNSHGLRTAALNKLLENLAGTELLLSKMSAVEKNLLTVDEVLTAQKELKEYFGAQLYDELVKQYSKRANEEMDVSLLRRLFGKSSFTDAEWEVWQEHLSIGKFQKRIVDEILSMKDGVPTCMMRRCIPHVAGEVKPEALGSYIALARSGQNQLSLMAAESVLFWSSDVSVIDSLLSLIAEGSKFEQKRAIWILKTRFAVNFFFDVEEWSQWRQRSRPTCTLGKVGQPVITD